jgi:AAA domain/RepB DNA-primase from phage plasmid
LKPDLAQMMAMVAHLFADQPRGLIELAWTDPNQGAPRHAQLFPLDQLDELVEKAAAVNAEKRNVYIGAALRKETTPPFGRTSAEDYHATTVLWSDHDDEGGAVRAAETCKALGARPTMVVFTGHQPHARCQCWWRLDEPLQDAAQAKMLLGQIQTRLGSDAAVVDPARVMRLAGSIAWPTKSGRVVELTEGQPVNGAHVYGVERLKAIFGSAKDKPSNGGASFDDFFQEGADVVGLIAKIQSGQQWDNSVLKLTAHWIVRGWADVEILLTAPALTLPGYTVDQTRAEMDDKIRRGRAQTWGQPDPEHKLGPMPTEPQRAAAIDPGKVSWHWWPYLPCGQVTLLAGYGGGGKGLVSMDFAARLTTGTRWPLSTQAPEAASVLWCEAEDPRAQVLVPRLIAARGDRERVFFANPRELVVLNLAAFIKSRSIGLIVLSPLVSFLNGLKDVIGELAVRKTLEGLQEAIEDTRCAAIGICHLNKKTDLGAVERILGSVAFVNFSRSALLIAKDHDSDAVRLAHGKFNLSVKGPDLLFRPQHIGDDPTDQSVRIEWEQPDEDVDPDRLFDRKQAESEADRTARAWLVAYLEKFGETPSSVVIAAAGKEGFGEKTIIMARKREPRCKTRKGGFGEGWMWWVS